MDQSDQVMSIIANVVCKIIQKLIKKRIFIDSGIPSLLFRLRLFSTEMPFQELFFRKSYIS